MTKEHQQDTVQSTEALLCDKTGALLFNGQFVYLIDGIINFHGEVSSGSTGDVKSGGACVTSRNHEVHYTMREFVTALVTGRIAQARCKLGRGSLRQRGLRPTADSAGGQHHTKCPQPNNITIKRLGQEKLSTGETPRTEPVHEWR